MHRLITFKTPLIKDTILSQKLDGVWHMRLQELKFKAKKIIQKVFT